MKYTSHKILQTFLWTLLHAQYFKLISGYCGTVVILSHENEVADSSLIRGTLNLLKTVKVATIFMKRV